MRADGHIVVAMSGASGAVYALTLVRQLLRNQLRISLLLSSAARQVLKVEQQLDWAADVAVQQRQVRQFFADKEQRLSCYAEQDFTAPVASGSSVADAMVIVPASMGTVARVACGISGNLVERVADVMLKEKQPLVIVPRETPLSTIHLSNMLTLSQAGAVILPAMPAFYSQPQTIDDVVDFVAGKICDAIGVNHQLYTRWGENI